MKYVWRERAEWCQVTEYYSPSTKEFLPMSTQHQCTVLFGYFVFVTRVASFFYKEN